MTEEDRALFLQTLQRGSIALDLPILTEAQQSAFLHFAALILQTNAHTNLTRITQPQEMATKHFLDSCTVFLAVRDLPLGTTVVDVGTGAGFPGVVLKILRPDLRLTLLDSLRKRLTFLEGVVDALALSDVTLLHARAEDAGRLPTHREQYDLVTARAVAALPTLAEWCGPLVRAGGLFVAMKSGAVDAELAPALPILKALRLRPEDDIALTLPPTHDDEEPATRRLLIYRKTASPVNTSVAGKNRPRIPAR